MDILHVIIVFPPVKGKGGPVVSVHNLAKAQVKRGDDVTVYTTDMKAPDERFDSDTLETTMDGINVRRFRNVSHRLAWNDLPFAFGMARALDDSIESFDVVHIHACRTFDAVFASRYARKHDIPYLMQPRGSVPRMSTSTRKWAFDVLFGRRVFRNADRVVASSRIESDQYGDVYPGITDDQVVHVPNGIDLEKYDRTVESESFKADHGIDPDDRLVLFLSRLHERKGADLLVEAVDCLGDDLSDITLAIAGPDDGHRPTLEAMVERKGLEDDVLLTAPVYGDAKLAAYSDADVFVLPSKDRYESFGNVVIEAMARRTAVVMTERCGVSEWVDAAGVVVSPEVGTLADAISDLLRDEERRTRLAEAGYEQAQTLQWSAIADRMNEVYDPLVE